MRREGGREGGRKGGREGKREGGREGILHNVMSHSLCHRPEEGAGLWLAHVSLCPPEELPQIEWYGQPHMLGGIT